MQIQIKKISPFPSPADLIYDRIDVLVYLENGKPESEDDIPDYLVEVTTLQYLSQLMEKDKIDFVPPDLPCIIVSKLEENIVKAAIQSYIDSEENQYWLKLYHVMPLLTRTDIKQLLDRQRAEEAAYDARFDTDK